MKNGLDFASQSDPARNRHFSRRWSEPPHCGGFKSIGEMTAEIVGRLPFQRKVERLHRLGPRAVGELLAELGAERGIQTIIDRKLGAYMEIEPEIIKAAGGDEFWQPPLHGVDP